MIRRLRLRLFLLPLVACALWLALPRESHAGFIQTQRAQQYVAITVNVTPGPYGYGPAGSGHVGEIAYAHKHGRGGGADDALAPTLSAAPRLIAQASVQQSVPVQANVSPDPMAGTFAITPNSATLSVQAGNSVTVSCAYQVKIVTTITLWTVDVGLANDFSGSFNGNNLAHNSYLATPKPTATPFIVYPDNNNAWAIMDKNGGNKTYCVDLTLNVPITVLGGVYSTTAVYTLYY